VSEKKALYRFFDAAGALLYIGRTLRPPWDRWREHRAGKTWWHEVATITIELVDTKEIVSEERRAILAENPRYNRERFPVERSPIVPPRVWEPLPADLRRRVAVKARKYADAETLTSRIALAMVVYKASAHGCRPMDVARAAGMTQEQVKALVVLARKERPELPPIASRHGSGRRTVRAMRAAREAA
jgi:hypothetical protein